MTKKTQETAKQFKALLDEIEEFSDVNSDYFCKENGDDCLFALGGLGSEDMLFHTVHGSIASLKAAIVALMLTNDDARGLLLTAVTDFIKISIHTLERKGGFREFEKMVELDDDEDEDTDGDDDKPNFS